MVAAVFRTIFAQPSPEAASLTWDTVRDQLTAGCPRIGPLMDDAKAGTPSGALVPFAGVKSLWNARVSLLKNQLETLA